jgi:hypothetical protein
MSTDAEQADLAAFDGGEIDTDDERGIKPSGDAAGGLETAIADALSDDRERVSLCALGRHFEVNAVDAPDGERGVVNAPQPSHDTNSGEYREGYRDGYRDGFADAQTET